LTLHLMPIVMIFTALDAYHHGIDTVINAYR